MANTVDPRNRDRKCPNCRAPPGTRHNLRDGLTVITTDGKCIHKPTINIVEQRANTTPFAKIRFVFYKAKSVMNLMTRFFKTTMASIKRLILLFKHIGVKYPKWRVLKYRDLRAMVVYIAAPTVHKPATITQGTQTEPDDPALILETAHAPLRQPMYINALRPRPLTRPAPTVQPLVIQAAPPQTRTQVQRYTRATNSVVINTMYTVSTLVFIANNLLRTTGFFVNNVYSTTMIATAALYRTTTITAVSILRSTTATAAMTTRAIIRAIGILARNVLTLPIYMVIDLTTLIKTIVKVTLLSVAYIMRGTVRAVGQTTTALLTSPLALLTSIIQTVAFSVGVVINTTIRTIARVIAAVLNAVLHTIVAALRAATELTQNTTRLTTVTVSIVVRTVLIAITIIIVTILQSSTRTAATIIRTVFRLASLMATRFKVYLAIAVCTYYHETIIENILHTGQVTRYLGETILSEIYLYSPLYIPLNYAYYLYRDLIPSARPRPTTPLPRYNKMLNKRAHIFLKLIILYLIYHYRLNPIWSFTLHIIYRGLCLLDYYRMCDHQARTTQPTNDYAPITFNYVTGRYEYLY